MRTKTLYPLFWIFFSCSAPLACSSAQTRVAASASALTNGNYRAAIEKCARLPAAGETAEARTACLSQIRSAKRAGHAYELRAADTAEARGDLGGAFRAIHRACGYFCPDEVAARCESLREPARDQLAVQAINDLAAGRFDAAAESFESANDVAGTPELERGYLRAKLLGSFESLSDLNEIADSVGEVRSALDDILESAKKAASSELPQTAKSLLRADKVGKQSRDESRRKIEAAQRLIAKFESLRGRFASIAGEADQAVAELRVSLSRAELDRAAELTLAPEISAAERRLQAIESRARGELDPLISLVSKRMAELMDDTLIVRALGNTGLRLLLNQARDRLVSPIASLHRQLSEYAAAVRSRRQQPHRGAACVELPPTLGQLEVEAAASLSQN